MKRQIPSHQNEEYNPTRPNINLTSLVNLSTQNLGSHIIRCTTKRVKQLVLSNLIGHGTEFEIRNFQISIIVEQEILGFKVAVINPTRVAKSDGRDQLLEVLASYVLFDLWQPCWTARRLARIPSGFAFAIFDMFFLFFFFTAFLFSFLLTMKTIIKKKKGQNGVVLIT